MSNDRRRVKRTPNNDRREGSRIVVVSGPRGDLTHAMGFYRNIVQLHLAYGFEEGFVLDNPEEETLTIFTSHLSEGERKPVPDSILQALQLKIGANSIIVADLTAPSRQVESDLLFARGLGARAIILRVDGDQVPKFTTGEVIAHQEEVELVATQEHVNSTINQIGRVILNLTTPRTPALTRFLKA